MEECLSPNLHLSKPYTVGLEIKCSNFIFQPKAIPMGAFWRPTDQDQVLTTWSESRQNGLVLNSRLCDVTALQSSKSDINIQ